MTTFSVRGDPNLEPKQEFERVPAGVHEAVGIFDYFSKDGQGFPCFIVQNGELVARFKFQLADLSEGPAMSATLEKLLKIASLAFGVDVSGYDTRPTTGLLEQIKAGINASGKIVKIRSNDAGWVQFVEGMEPPPDVLFRWKFVGFRSLDKTEPPQFVVREVSNGRGGTRKANTVYCIFAVSGDMFGNPSPYDGMTKSTWLECPFDGAATLPNGRSIPDLKTVETAEGLALHTYAKTWLHLWGVFGDDADIDWQYDPEQSRFGVDELANPLPVLQDVLLRAGREGIAALVSNKGYLNLKLADFKVVPNTAAAPTKSAAPASAEPSSGALYLWDLVKAIEAYAEMPVFEPTPAINSGVVTKILPAAKEWAKENIAHACQQLGIAKPTAVGKFPEADAVRLTAWFKQAQEDKIPFDLDEEEDDL